MVSIFYFMMTFSFSKSQYLGVQWANAQNAKGAIAGHWGFQFYAERSGWESSEDDEPLPQHVEYFLRSSVAWPQEPVLDCFNEIASHSFPVFSPYLPHVHQQSIRANYHASAIYGQPPIRSLCAVWLWLRSI